MKKLKLILAAAALVLFAQSAFAGELVVALAGAKGTMKDFHDQTCKVCSQPTLTEKQSPNGSIGVINDLLSNEATIGYALEDSLYARKIVDGDTSVDNLKTLVNLYPSEIHIVALATSNIRQFTDCGNKRLGVYGGAAVTARVLQARTGVRYASIQPARTEDELVGMLNGGKVDVIMGIGGQPLKWVKDLGPKFRLVEFNAFDKVNDIYMSAALTKYPNLGTARSIATNTLIVTYDYESPGKIADLAAFKNCINSNLSALRETTGNHPKWREVRANSKSKWPMYTRLKGGSVAPSKKRKG